MIKKKKQESKGEVLGKMMKFCAYQERSVWELEKRMEGVSLSREEKDEIIDQLMKEDFLNEERFVKAFVKGKVKVKRWGVYKIMDGLKKKGVSNVQFPLIYKEIEQETYEENLNYLIEQRKRLNSADDSAKLYRYLMGRGYESDIIIATLKERGLMQ